MNDIITVAKFSIREMIKRKSFIVSTLIILLVIVIGFNIPNIIKMFGSNTENEKIIISDIDNIYENSLTDLNNLGYDITVTNDSIDDIKEKVKNDEIGSGIIVEKVDNTVNLTYVVENEMFMGNSEILDILASIYENNQLNKLDLTEEEILSINPEFNYHIESADDVNVNVFAVMIISMVLFFAIYFFSYQVSSSITIEKTSKIIETLVTSTSPRNIVLGKTIGIGIVGLCQVVLIMLVALVSAKLFVDHKTLSNILDLSSFNAPFIVVTIIYFILGYFIYSCLYALTGSTVSKPEDIQSANTPVSMITVIGFYLAYFTMMNPTGNINLFTALFPISSPFCMPFRVMMGVSSPGEMLLSLVILIASIILIAHVTIKVYSNAILNYGTKLNIKNIIKMYKQK